MKKTLNSWKVERFIVIATFVVAIIVGWFGPEATRNWWNQQTVEQDKSIKASHNRNPSSLYKLLSVKDKKKVREYIQKYGMKKTWKNSNSILGK